MAFRVSSVWLAAFALCLTLLLGGCSGSRGGIIPYDVANFAAPDAPTAVASEAAYKLAPLDTVSVNVFQVGDLSREYTIDLGGQLSMPLIGSVDAVGLTTNELARALEARLGARYLQNPNITVSLKESARRVITVDGSVRQPGIFPAIGPMTLIQAIALARGTDDIANPHRVAIFRMIGGKRMAAAFDLVSIRRGEAPDPAVYAGDTIVVDGSAVRKAQRDILQSLPLASIFTTVL